MEDGLLNNKKIAFIIQARMKSTRLPGKILLPIPLGSYKPLLSWITNELKLSKFNAEIIVATSLNTENDVLVSFCEKENVGVFRGSEEDVLSRFTSIAKENEYDCIVRLTADNPIVDIEALDNVVSFHFSENNDYTNTSGFPIGMNFEVISSKALISLENYCLTDADKEHVTLFIKNNNEFKKGEFIIGYDEVFKKIRLTVDYASDYTLLSSILSQVNENDNLKGIKLVMDTYLKFPWIFESNFLNFQKKDYPTLDSEIKDAFSILDQFELKKTSEILKRYLKS